jgi:hypothetical protein
MGIVSGVSYGLLWLFVIAFIIFEQYRFIMPTVTLIIGLHFLPQAKIMNRTLDYYVAPFPIVTALVAFYFAFQTNMPWLEVSAIASIGGVIATAIYGIYTVNSYNRLVEENGLSS